MHKKAEAYPENNLYPGKIPTQANYVRATLAFKRRI